MYVRLASIFMASNFRTLRLAPMRLLGPWGLCRRVLKAGPREQVGRSPGQVRDRYRQSLGCLCCLLLLGGLSKKPPIPAQAPGTPQDPITVTSGKCLDAGGGVQLDKRLALHLLLPQPVSASSSPHQVPRQSVQTGMCPKMSPSGFLQ